jgi:DNA-binding transcriptional ArsR family regulator
MFMLPLNDVSCDEADAGKDAICSMTRLIGDPEKAKEKVNKLHALMKKIDTDGGDLEVNIFKAAADPSRLKILKLLREGELCVCEIMTALKKPQSTTSHHLSILKDAGLIKERKEGKWSHYRISDGAVIEMLNQARLLKDI